MVGRALLSGCSLWIHGGVALVPSVPFSLIIGGILLIGIGDLFLAVREMILNSRDSVSSDAGWLKHNPGYELRAGLLSSSES